MTSLAVILRFDGEPSELLALFERARIAWIAAQENDYERPLSYAACKSDTGIAVVTTWATAAGHRAFGQGMHEHVRAAGLAAPASIERLRVESSDWEDG